MGKILNWTSSFDANEESGMWATGWWGCEILNVYLVGSTYITWDHNWRGGDNTSTTYLVIALRIVRTRENGLNQTTILQLLTALETRTKRFLVILFEKSFSKISSHTGKKLLCFLFITNYKPSNWYVFQEETFWILHFRFYHEKNSKNKKEKTTSKRNRSSWMRVLSVFFLNILASLNASDNVTNDSVTDNIIKRFWSPYQTDRKLQKTSCHNHYRGNKEKG